MTGSLPSLSRVRCLVTGGAGFIGSHLVEMLVGLDADVTVLDDCSTGDIEHLAAVRDHVRFLKGSILDRGALREACDGQTWVFHLAAAVSVAESYGQPERYQAICSGGTRAVVAAAERAGARRVVYAASASAYGEPMSLPVDERHRILPGSPYARGKLEGEAHLLTASLATPLETVRLRLFNVYGPRQSANSSYAGVISAFSTALREGRAPRIFGDGLQTRDFVHVRDVAEAFVRAATTEGLTREVFNIGTGRECSLIEMLDVLGEAFGKDVRAQHLKPRPGDIRRSVADISSAIDRLGYRPAVGLRTGLADMARGRAARTVPKKNGSKENALVPKRTSGLEAA